MSEIKVEDMGIVWRVAAELSPSDRTTPVARFTVVFRSFVACIFASLTASCFAWVINSRELVDVEFSAGESLIILVSSPHAAVPGIYQWRRDADAPTLLCAIAAPTSFSFDRKTIIERVAGAVPELRFYEPSSCRMINRIKVQADIVDADIRGKRVAVAVRLPDATQELRVYGRPNKREKEGTVLARSVIGRNVEMGFAPDGASIVNFDLSDGGATAWRVPTLASLTLPVWMTEGETTFVPGSRFVKRYARGAMSVARWPSGTPVYTMKAERTVRLRQLSATGRYGALHSFSALNTANQSLDWIDFATQKKVHIASGSIDNAALNASGSRVAWVLRSSEQTDVVSVQFAQVNAEGSAISTNGPK